MPDEAQTRALFRNQLRLWVHGTKHLLWGGDDAAKGRGDRATDSTSYEVLRVFRIHLQIKRGSGNKICPVSQYKWRFFNISPHVPLTLPVFPYTSPGNLLGMYNKTRRGMLTAEKNKGEALTSLNLTPSACHAWNWGRRTRRQRKTACV